MSNTEFPKYISREQFQQIIDALSTKTRQIFVTNAVYKQKIKDLEATIQQDNNKIAFLEGKVDILETTLTKIMDQHQIPEEDFDPDALLAEMEEQGH